MPPGNSSKAALPLASALLALACAGATVTTTVLPPHRLERPICAVAVIPHDRPEDVPPGGRVLARLRIEGQGPGVSSRKMRDRLREEAAKLGANHLLTAELTTPSTLAALGVSLAEGWNREERERIRNEPLSDPAPRPRVDAPLPTDPAFYGRGVAYAIFVPADTLRTKLECPE